MGQALWFASRATGLVALPLLTVSLVLGIVGASRLASLRWPRFTLGALHRNLSMITVLFLAVHVSSSIVDPYAGIGWLDAVVPFVSGYHPFWLGLGTVGLDLVLAVVVTSMIRTRVSPRAWRAVHWASYACWPIGVAHGMALGGEDSRLGWVIVLNVLCAVVVVAAVVWRLGLRDNSPDQQVRNAANAGGG